MFAFTGSYQWCCRRFLSLYLSEMSLAHILERSSVGICLLFVGLVLLLWNSQRNTLFLLSFHFLFMRKTTPACPLLASKWYSRWPLWRVVKLSPLFFGLLRALSCPISCCFISVHLPVLARVHLLVMFLHCMLQSSVVLPWCGGSSIQHALLLYSWTCYISFSNIQTIETLYSINCNTPAYK